MPSPMKGVLKELGFLSVFGIVIGLVFQQSATDLTDQGAASGDAFSNSAMFPQIIATLMAVVCGVIAVNAMRAKACSGSNPTETSRSDVLRVVLGAVVVFGYILIFRVAGYYISTALAAFLLLLLFQVRSWLALILFPVCLTLVIGYVFEILFQVVLPLGVFELTLQPLFR